MILHIFMHIGQLYHSLHFIIWHWFGGFSLRSFLVGWGFMCSLVIWESLFIPCNVSLEYDLLMTRACTFIIKKKKIKKNGVVICLYLTSYSIEHVLLFKGLLGLSLRVCASFPWGLFVPWVTLVMHLECQEFTHSCTHMGWSSFIPLSHCLLLCVTTFF